MRGIDVRVWLPPPSLGPAAATPVPPWIHEIRRRRGEAVFDGGLRPAFLREDGTFDDPDDADLFGYHLVQTTADGLIVAGMRVTPLEALPDSAVRRFNPVQAQNLLDALRLRDTDVLEAGRLWTAPQWRDGGLGAELVLAGVALGQVLRRGLLWGTVGERMGAPLLHRLGWQTRVEFGSLDKPDLADTLRIATIDPGQPPALVRATVSRLVAQLAAQWEDNQHVRG